MELNEAIKHAKEKASNLRAMHYMDKEQARQCWLCAEEHDQLAGWFEELLSWRKKALSTIDIVTCKECKYADTQPFRMDSREKEARNLFCGRTLKYVDMDWFCADGERKENG